MDISKNDGIHVSGVKRNGTSFCDGFRSRPVERGGKDGLRFYAASEEDPASAMVVVVAQQTGFRIEDQAWRGTADIADIRSASRPGLSAVGGGELKLCLLCRIFSELGPADREDLSVTEINGRLFSWPIGIRKPFFDDILRPGRSVVRADERSPRIVVCVVAVLPGKPECHKARPRHGKDVRDLDRHGIELRSNDVREVDAVSRSVEIVAEAVRTQRSIAPFSSRPFPMVTSPTSGVFTTSVSGVQVFPPSVEVRA